MGEYTFFDHTGDFGMEIEAASVADAYQTLAAGFMDLLLDGSGRIAARERRKVEVSGVDAADTMVAFANEVLFLFETEGFLVAEVAIERASQECFSATLRGEVRDPARHMIARIVKAVTHHEARIEEDASGRVRARLIFDL